MPGRGSCAGVTQRVNLSESVWWHMWLPGSSVLVGTE